MAEELYAREAKLQRFLDLAAAAFHENAPCGQAARALTHIFTRLDTPMQPTVCTASHRPACKHLPEVASTLPRSEPRLNELFDAFFQLTPLLNWHHRDGDSSSGSSNFSMGHANAFIVGPGGLEERNDVILGASLLAPDVIYPVHKHRPEEIYLFLSQGEFLHGDNGWNPTVAGSSLYNPPWIEHAMRSKTDTFLAFWALNNGEGHRH